jgi:hypothetical protein
MSSSSHNKVLIALNKLTLEEKTSYSIVPSSSLGKIITAMTNIESKKTLTHLQCAHIRLQNVLNKHPNAAHNKHNPHLQEEYKDAKKNYNTLLKKQHRGN